jgi:cyclopropane-fatty-acyl-phospholipid synthase
MITTTTASNTEPTVRLLGELFAHAAPRSVSFRLWDGTTWPDEEPRAATIVLKHPGAVREMFASGTEKGLAEAYLHDDFDVEGDIETACELAEALADGGRHGPPWANRVIVRTRRRATGRP